MSIKDYQNGLIVGLSAGSTQVEAGNIGYKVTFKVDGNDYYIASCQQGESITEPPTPTGTGTFTAWQLNGVDVAFPYTPSADVELTAYFQSVRTEMEVSVAGTPLINIGENPYLTKTSDGMAVCAYALSAGDIGVILVSKTDAYTYASGKNATWGQSFSYNGETYYYHNYSGMSQSTYTVSPQMVNVQEGYGNSTVWAGKVLDHYFYND